MTVPTSEFPLAIGGIGGSGTRVVAQILLDIGFYLGSDLNQSNDNLWFTLLFKRAEILSEGKREFDLALKTFLKAMRGGETFNASETAFVLRAASMNRTQHTSLWLSKRAESLLASQNRAPTNARWGWKEPNTHIVIDRLIEGLPSLRYIHVVRNGLDMAFSSNQNQLKLWGPHLLGGNVSVSPRNSLRFWSLANRRVIRIFESKVSSLLLLNFDRLCLLPEQEIGKLLGFVKYDYTASQLRRLTELIRVPDSIGRFKTQAIDNFDPLDVKVVEQLGFDTTTR
jgi:hypothetical protein